MQEGHESLADYQELLKDGFDNMQEISHGGGGIIIKAHHKGLDKDVVIKKIIRSKVKALGKTGERDVLKNLKHAYLPQIYDYIERGDDVFTVMEYIPGQSFADLLKDGKRKFGKKDLVKWTAQLCDVVAYLHSQKPAIIHCDIKPGNLMLTPQGNICLIDFNISSVKTEEGLSSIGYTPEYAPAEQFLVVMQQREKYKALMAAGIYPGTPTSDGSTALSASGNAAAASGTSAYGNAGTGTLIVNASQAGGRIETELAGNAPVNVGNAGVINGNETQMIWRPEQGGETEVIPQAMQAGAGPMPAQGETALASYNLGPANAGVPQQSPVQGSAGMQQVPAQGNVAAAGPQNVGRQGDEYSISDVDPKILDVLKKERIQGQIDERTDIYSVGTTLYHIATGVLPKPFYEANVRLRDLRPDLPDGLVFLITKAMRLRPQDRFRGSDEMLKIAVKINKLDKRYKNVNRAENLLALLFGALMIGCTLIAIHGWNLMGSETRNKYQSLVAKMAQAREDRDFDRAQQYYDDALLLFPNEDDAYYEMALFFYEGKEYERCLEYVVNDVLNRDELMRSDLIDRFYYMAASCFFALEEYEDSIPYFEEAISYHLNDALYYRDYVIALARLGETTKARKALDKAKRQDVVEDVLLLLEGEISFMEGDALTARESLEECIQKSKDPEVLVRAYVKLDEVYRALEESDLVRLASLEEAVDALPESYRIIPMERLGQAYMDHAKEYQDNQYYKKALDLFFEVRKIGYGTFQTDENIAVLYEALGDYDAAIKWLKAMIKERGEDYRCYKRLAFVELERQGKINPKEQEYETFLEYYRKARKLYEEAARRNTDTQMQQLEDYHQTLIDKGWLDE